ncbi:translation initiation factor Sui1 [Phycisphaerae bacterium RAS2]|nr:translation initiation factor Sui1 [Phycisphaerae bacterium RAS2]
MLPKDQPVRVSRKRISGGRFVTTITGLVLGDENKAAMLKRFKASLGTGGTIQDACIELQGDHRDKLVDLLRQEGYRAKPSGG